MILVSLHNIYSFRLNFHYVFLCMLALLSPSIAKAQVLTLTNATAAPIQGAGHDYIHLLNETVNPANGSVSVSIDLPMPKGRGIQLPFSISYNSGQVVISNPTITQFRNYDVATNYAGVMWLNNTDLLSSSGWSYGLPFANWNYGQVSAQGAYKNPNGDGQYCPYSTGYVFRDMMGGAHPLGLGTVNSTICRQGALQGGDDFFAASITAQIAQNSIPQSASSTPLTVSDLTTGTTYKFTSDLLFGRLGTGLLPNLIEDRNGNQINISQSIQPASSAGLAFAFTDTLKRTLVSDTGFSVNPETLTAGGLNYTIQWRTANVSYDVPATENLATMGGNCSGVGSVHIPAGGSALPLNVVSSIILPNGQAYHFYYGDDNPHGLSNPFGLLSEIDYPDGGSVQYTWKYSDQYSDTISYPAGTAGLAPSDTTTNFASVITDGCQYQYKAPVVATRTVFYFGRSPALTQNFTYATAFSSKSKSTSVTTNDLITGKTALKQYTYGLVYQSLPLYSNSTISPVVPVEQSVATYDWGNTSTPIKVETKAWYDQYKIACTFGTLDGTVSSGHFYQYGLGAQITDDKEYDFGQIHDASSACTAGGTNASAGPVPTAPADIVPVREITAKYKTFTNPLGTVFAMPQAVTTYGNGAKVAEIDYGYDESSLVSISAVQHDENSFLASSVVNRGNITSITRQCPGCVNAVSSYAYDETGQVISSTDACGNSPCLDIAGTNHTSLYSYTDSPSGGNAGGNSNAYVTLITNPFGQTQKFTYNYATGQIGSATDRSSNTTSYFYRDPLNRLTLTQYPDGGSTASIYNDSSHSVKTTTTISTTVSSSMTSIKDGMGHVVQVQLSSDPFGTAYKEMTYTGLGQILSASNAHWSSSLATDGFTTYTYDALGRETYQCQPDNATGINACAPGNSYLQWSYLGNVTVSKDEVGNRWSHTSDFLGRLTQVVEPGGLTTAYLHDALSNLGCVDQWGIGRIGEPCTSIHARRFSYDALSRLTTSINPETGTICYGSGPNCTGGYDGNGNLFLKTDARGQATHYSYDALNRITSKVYTGGSGYAPSSCYQYDSAASSVPNSIGRLVAEWTQPGSCPTNGSGVPANALSSRQITAYDAMGRITGETQCAIGPCSPSAVSVLAYTYDLAGNPTGTNSGVVSGASAAAGLMWSGTFDSAGRPDTLTSSLNDAAHPGQLFQANATTAATLGMPAYGPFGLTAAQYGLPLGNLSGPSALSDLRSYDIRQRLVSKTVNGQSGVAPPPPPPPPPPPNGQLPVVQVDPIVHQGGSALMSISVNCPSQCGTATVLIDNAYAFGTGIPDGGTISGLGLPSSLPVATHTITAIYNGSSSFPAGTSAVVSFQVVQSPATVVPVSMSISANPITFGQSPFVRADNGYNDGVHYGKIILNGQYYGGFSYTQATALFLPANLAPGNYTIEIQFLGTANYAPSSQTLAFTVFSPIPVVSTASIIHRGGSGPMSIAINCPSRCGTATFSIDENYVAGTGIADGGSETLTLPSWNLPVGSHTLIANYAGSASFPAGSSAPFTFQIVDPPATAVPVNVSISPSSVTSGQQATVAADNGYSDGWQYGQFFLDGQYYGGFNYSQGASFTFPVNLPSGSIHTVRVDFMGTPNYAFSSGSATFTVQ